MTLFILNGLIILLFLVVLQVEPDDILQRADVFGTNCQDFFLSLYSKRPLVVLRESGFRQILQLFNSLVVQLGPAVERNQLLSYRILVDDFS